MQKKNTNENINRLEVKKELLKPKIDVVFQSLFNQKNEEITKVFISDLLEENITNIEINNDRELLRDRPDDKLGILDLEAEVNNNEKIDVEIQLIDRHNLIERLLFYWSKLYLSDIKRGDDYTNSKRTVVIAIIDYELEKTREIEKMETIWRLIEEKHNKLVLTEKMEIRIIELSKAKNTYNKDKENRKAQWLMFLNNPNEEEVQEIMEKNEEIKKATVVVKEMTEDEKMERLAFLRWKAIMDEKDIYAAGLDKKAKEIAKKLLKMNMPIEDIVKVTDLSKEDIEKIKE